MAKRPAGHGQRFSQIAVTGTPAGIADAIEKQVADAISDKRATAAILLFPEIDSLERLAETFLALQNRPGWAVTMSKLHNQIVGPMVAVHVVCDVPFGNGTVPSEALIFGPFQEFPPTRRSPVTAMEVYVGEPMALDPKTLQTTTKANLAHIFINATSKAFEKLMSGSTKGRLVSLGGAEDNRAKAKVSFVLPPALATKLGCQP